MILKIDCHLKYIMIIVDITILNSVQTLKMINIINDVSKFLVF